MQESLATQRFGNRYLYARIAGGAAILVVGMGTAEMSLFQVTMSSVAGENAGAGSGAMQAFQHIGAALGIAVAGQIFFSLLGDVLLYRRVHRLDTAPRLASHQSQVGRRMSGHSTKVGNRRFVREP